MKVGKEFTFDAAHFLPRYHGTCERMHGHTYRLHVTVEGPIDKEGLVIDFVILKKVVKKEVLDKLDHRLINDLIKVPSCENIAAWIWKKLKTNKSLKKVRLTEIALWETPTSFALYHGEDE